MVVPTSGNRTGAAAPASASMAYADAHLEDVPMRDLLQADLDHFGGLVESLFSRLATLHQHQHPQLSALQNADGLGRMAGAGGKAGAGAAGLPADAPPAEAVLHLLRALNAQEATTASHLRLAREHAANAARIEALRERIALREQRAAAAIAHLGSVKAQLDQIVKDGERELKVVDHAEKNPLPMQDVLSYASRLSSITSAPPGFKLPTQAALSAAQEAAAAAAAAGGEVKLEPGGAGEGAEGGAGADGEGKPKAAPPMAFYDPKMPGMPEQLPFPDEGMMRRGALGALAVGQGVTFAPVPQPGEAAAAATAAGDVPAAAAPAQTEEMIAEARRLADEARARQEAEEADAFDLDLN